MITEKYWDSIL